MWRRIQRIAALMFIAMVFALSVQTYLWWGSWRSHAIVGWLSPASVQHAKESAQQIKVLQDAVKQAEPEEKAAVIERFTKNNGDLFAPPPPATPWRLYSAQNGMPYSGGMSGLPGGGYASLEDCQAALEKTMEPRITMLRQQAATARNISVAVTQRPRYIGIRQKIAGARIDTDSVCYLAQEGE